MLTEQLTKRAVSRTSTESLRFVMFFETLLINLAKIGVSELAVAPHGSRRSVRQPVDHISFFESRYAHRARDASAPRRPQLDPQLSCIDVANPVGVI